MYASTIFASILALAHAALGAPAVTPREPREIIQSWPEPIADQASPDGSIQKRFAGGWCGVHNNEVRQDQGSILVEAQEGGMPDKMYATIFPSGNPSSGDVAEFRYGDRAWRSGGANSEYFEGDLLVCKVGNWNTGAGLVPSYEEIDLDCGFTC
ncbi:hypothetical protein BKA56DRAFT_678211 [Ilyonectria sp. MPI-CAGE-AT-0026]|nr:hypothetical protein BKA56DRAFT_678211 [Ilyonectria sp. MPI-CAGE-AT-0026]